MSYQASHSSSSPTHIVYIQSDTSTPEENINVNFPYKSNCVLPPLPVEFSLFMTSPPKSADVVGSPNSVTHGLDFTNNFKILCFLQHLKIVIAKQPFNLSAQNYTSWKFLRIVIKWLQFHDNVIKCNTIKLFKYGFTNSWAALWPIWLAIPLSPAHLL